MNHETSKTPLVALVIDDESQIRRLLRITLEANAYKVFEAANGEEGILEAAQHRPDIILLDLGLPDIEGITVLKRIREWSQVPIIILSVRERDEDKVAVLDCGADDYMTKPFSSAELLARLRVALRHSQPRDEVATFRSGDVEVDLIARTVRIRAQEVKLTATEYALLHLFVKHAGKVLTQRQIMREVWGPNYLEQTHYLRVYMKHLREKLEENPSEPKLFITEPGVGYRLVTKD